MSSLRTFYICRDRRFVTIPANIKKSDYKLCYKQINVFLLFFFFVFVFFFFFCFFFFISIKNFIKLNKSKH